MIAQSMGTIGFGTLVACRVALGAGEGPATPVALHSTVALPFAV
jgi:hypothetical protein